MRDLSHLNKNRVLFRGSMGGPTWGAFLLRIKGRNFKIIASDGEGWDHVSVSCADRTPTWDELEIIKHLFFEPHETAMQLHVPKSDHVNVHTNCLHLWRPHHVEIPRPPEVMV